jgi:HEAT repeat protein
MWLGVLTVLLPAVAGAQAPRPVQPRPAGPPVPVAPAAPMAPVAPTVPVQPAVPAPFDFDFHLDVVPEPATLHGELAHLWGQLDGQVAELAAAAARQASVAVGQAVARGSQRGADGDYQSGLSLIQARRYDQAIQIFTRIVGRKAERADAAYYWKAFAEFKLAQADNALASISALRKEHPSSRYLADANVLEADVKRLAGQPAPPAATDDDEIKLLAIQGLSRTGEAVPLLENVLRASNSLNVKRRALYVLALNDDPRGKDVLMRYARGAGTPDLQIEAIRYLGARRAAVTSEDFVAIYKSSADTGVKLAVIDALRSGKDTLTLMKLATDKSEKPDVKISVIPRLSGLATAEDVMVLYRQESDPAMRSQVLAVLGRTLAVDQLATIARTDADQNVRTRAIAALGSQRNENTRKALVGLYEGQPSRDVRRTIINALSGSENAEALVALARQETDLELKRDLVRRLSELAGSSKVAADYLMDQLR